MLHESIFERMKTDDGGPASRRKHARKHLAQCRFQESQLVVDGNPQRLKHERRRVVFPSTASPHGFGRQLCELAGRRDRLRSPPSDDLCGDLPGVPFFAEVAKNAFQFFFGRSPQQFVRGSSPRRVEPQVEGSVAVETEPSLLVGQLIRRIAEVQQDAIDVGDIELIENGTETGVAGVYEVAVGGVEDRPGSDEHLRVPVQADQDAARADLFEERLAVTAGAHRAVDYGLPGFDGQQPQNVPHQNGLMDRSAGITGRRRRHDDFPRDGERWRDRRWESM